MRLTRRISTPKLTTAGTLTTKLGGVTALVPAAPDYKFHHPGGKFPLTFKVESTGDTTLLIHLPDGTWVADDDSGGGNDPLITFAKPQKGRHGIYVGTLNDTPVAAKLIITEVRSATPKPAPTDGPDRSLSPIFGRVTLKAGYAHDPFTKKLTAGGPLKTLLGGVDAYVTRALSFKVFYTAGRYPLTFNVESEGDTTLLIHLPDNKWIANDDGGKIPNRRNPLVMLETPQSGAYDIYVGTYDGKSVAATLSITERD